MIAKKRFSGLPLIIVAAVLVISQCSRREKESIEKPERIVSLAPSITETLFALGLGEKVVGVTSYCRFPPEADSIEEVGGYVDANLERIISLKPDIVILQREHEKQRLFLKRYDIPTLAVEYRSIAQMCSSFVSIGRRCGAPKQADSLVALFDSLLKFDSTISKRPDVLLCVGRSTPGGGSIQSVYAAGAGTFYNTLIEAAGGSNAFSDSVVQYPKISREGLITLSPDIIIDVAPAMEDYLCSALISDWESMVMIPAVRDNRVYCLAADYAAVPGPRVLELYEDLKMILSKF